MANLRKDLTKYSQELVTKRDVKAGMKLAREILGLVSLGDFALVTLTAGIPVIGFFTFSGSLLGQTMFRLAKHYSRLSGHERKQIRALVRYLQGGFSLEDLVDDEPAGEENAAA